MTTDNNGHKKKIVLLDRDGTVIVEKEFLADPRGVELIPGSARSIKRLKKAGYAVAIVTNQSGVGRGFYTLAQMKATNKRTLEVLAKAGAKIDSLEWCPHHPQAEVRKYRRKCNCRKPAIGMGLRAARKAGATLKGVVVVGDRLVDVAMGHNLGGKGILVLTGYGRKHKALARKTGVKPDAIVGNLAKAVEWILKKG
jgi:histidinol-phosphate phosphatase family protein